MNYTMALDLITFYALITSMKLSIVVPCFNEVETIMEVVEGIKTIDIGDVEKEIILIEDGSTDGTRELLESIEGEKGVVVFYQPQNQGKGRALKKGFELATGDIIIIQDADLEYSPKEYAKIIAPLVSRQADVVYGSRYLNKKLYEGRYVYDFGVHFLTLMFNILFGTRLTDVETCYKAFPREFLKGADFRSKSFDIELEITAWFVKNNKKIKEVTISYFPRGFRGGKKINWKDGIFAIWRILVLRLWH